MYVCIEQIKWEKYKALNDTTLLFISKTKKLCSSEMFVLTHTLQWKRQSYKNLVFVINSAHSWPLSTPLRTQSTTVYPLLGQPNPSFCPSPRAQLILFWNLYISIANYKTAKQHQKRCVSLASWYVTVLRVVTMCCYLRYSGRQVQAGKGYSYDNGIGSARSKIART